MKEIIDAVRFRFVQKEVGRLGKRVSRNGSDALTKREKELYTQYKDEYDKSRLELDKKIKIQAQN